jgi:lambda repressor-like predicted transcriptional regulator
MSDLSLSKLPPNDPENLLSPGARQRILRAILKSHQIREEALLRNLTRYQATRDPAVSFDDYLAFGEPFIDMAKAQMKAARVVLLAEDKEYRKLDLSECQLHQIMEFMLEARANSLELSLHQRDVLRLKIIGARPQPEDKAGSVTTGRGSEVTKAEASTTSPDGAARVLAFMEKNGLTQAQFATHSKISERTLRRFLAKLKVSARTWKDVAQALGVEVSELRKS